MFFVIPFQFSHQTKIVARLLTESLVPARAKTGLSYQLSDYLWGVTMAPVLVVQNKKAVSVYSTSKQIVLFDFAEQNAGRVAANESK